MYFIIAACVFLVLLVTNIYRQRKGLSMVSIDDLHDATCQVTWLAAAGVAWPLLLLGAMIYGLGLLFLRACKPKEK